eukprot:gnl/TRDRNA2_/TRDRNA2_159489_c0_seq2.p2 gnl/TRDRNA2_/TRDRNA2_159489_c0~~gnl/TRDRNA2_/TRDRNA2_159489_c0_seq2.p2  ORF type:complete len:190 (+),score=13.49 gnl/TRDRNA2_/TRDRNA2_159489_c0_seq2:151-720(+)
MLESKHDSVVRTKRHMDIIAASHIRHGTMRMRDSAEQHEVTNVTTCTKIYEYKSPLTHVAYRKNTDMIFVMPTDKVWMQLLTTRTRIDQTKTALFHTLQMQLVIDCMLAWMHLRTALAAARIPREKLAHAGSRMCEYTCLAAAATRTHKKNPMWSAKHLYIVVKSFETHRMMQRKTCVAPVQAGRKVVM